MKSNLPRNRRNSSGFTRSELLIVCAVVFGLMAVAVPSFFNKPRQSIGRVKNDMRSMATGIKTYFVDHKSYPAMVPLHHYVNSEKKLAKAGGAEAMTIFTGSSAVAGLTTPVAYVLELMEDPFAPEKSLPFAYHAVGPGWILYSPGPDRVYDLDPARDYDGQTLQPGPLLLLKTYDPTNGTDSTGDVWRVKQ